MELILQSTNIPEIFKQIYVKNPLFDVNIAKIYQSGRNIARFVVQNP